MSDNCDKKDCVLCNTCAWCEGAADLFYPSAGAVVCIGCVKDGELDTEKD